MAGWSVAALRRGVKRAGVLALLLLLALPGCAEAQALRCVATDGDSLRCGRERIRLLGLDAPEMNGRCARERRLAAAARDRLQSLIAGGASIRSAGEDRYGRTLARVRDRSGRDVARVLVAEGLARPYEGGRRRGWC
jgi:endonuclease YncB( thermonuclease family)